MNTTKHSNARMSIRSKIFFSYHPPPQQNNTSSELASNLYSQNWKIKNNQKKNNFTTTSRFDQTNINKKFQLITANSPVEVFDSNKLYTPGAKVKASSKNRPRGRCINAACGKLSSWNWELCTNSLTTILDTSAQAWKATNISWKCTFTDKDNKKFQTTCSDDCPKGEMFNPIEKKCVQTEKSLCNNTKKFSCKLWAVINKKPLIWWVTWECGIYNATEKCGICKSWYNRNKDKKVCEEKFTGKWSCVKNITKNTPWKCSIEKDIFWRSVDLDQIDKCLERTSEKDCLNVFQVDNSWKLVRFNGSEILEWEATNKKGLSRIICPDWNLHWSMNYENAEKDDCTKRIYENTYSTNWSSKYCWDENWNCNQEVKKFTSVCLWENWTSETTKYIPKCIWWNEKCDLEKKPSCEMPKCAEEYPKNYWKPPYSVEKTDMLKEKYPFKLNSLIGNQVSGNSKARADFYYSEYDEKNGTPRCKNWIIKKSEFDKIWEYKGKRQRSFNYRCYADWNDSVSTTCEVKVSDNLWDKWKIESWEKSEENGFYVKYLEKKQKGLEKLDGGTSGCQEFCVSIEVGMKTKSMGSCSPGKKSCCPSGQMLIALPNNTWPNGPYSYVKKLWCNQESYFK